MLCAIALLLGCSDMKRDAIGSFNFIFAFADDAELDFVREPIEISIERPIVTPRPEKLFRIQWGDTADIENASKHHIVLIAASLKSPADWGAYVRMNLSPEAMDSVKTGRFNIFIRNDPWMQNQILIILTARSAEELRQYILKNTNEIFDIINDYCNRNVADWIFGSYFGRKEKLDIERRIAEEYGFGIRVPRMFDWEKGTPHDRFLWLRALEPERWVFVWWTPLDSASVGKISLKWFSHIRDSLCAIFYEGDSLQPGMLTYERTTLLGMPAIMYRSRWRNPAAAFGGPVVGFILDDSTHSRRYILDGAVFAPAVRKEPYLRHCEVILRSFRTNPVAFLDSMKNYMK